MKKYFLSLFFALTSIIIGHSQIIWQENFESGSLPPGWTQMTNATDNGWKVGTAANLSSLYWPIPSNGSDQIAVTNDDACNCNKSNDILITPPLDFTGLSGIALSVDVFFGMGTYENFTERGTIEVSTNAINWTVLEELHGHPGWDTHKINLSHYANEDSVYIAFRYSDGGGWVFGLAIDNVTVEVPPVLDAALLKLNHKPYGLIGDSIVIRGSLLNNGLTPLTSIELEYSANGETAVPTIIEGLNIEAFATYEFSHPVIWSPSLAGDYDVSVDIKTINMVADEDSTNNSLGFQTEIFPEIKPVNRVDEFLLTEPVFTTIATQTEGLDKPNDLDFFPILAKNELWIVNEDEEHSGGSTLTIYDAGAEERTFLSRRDGNAWHFMSLPTGIAFSNNFNFATSPGIQDANHSGGTFTGPTLWSSDPEIYAQPSGGNGSHLDMLHGSPFSMGIESEEENIFWVFDGWDNTIVRYDFKEDHGPGNDDHSDGVVRRYSEIEVKRDNVVPSHLVLDRETGWMYVVDNGNDRVLRLDIHSGSNETSLPLINEPLAEHSQMSNVTWEVIINSGLDRPSGIDIIENRLLVGDYATGDIIVYDIENGFAELGRIATGQSGLTGIKIGPEGAIWYTNRLENEAGRIEPGEPTSIVNHGLIKQISVAPNPTSGQVMIDLGQFTTSENIKLELFDAVGTRMISMESVRNNVQLDLGRFADGVYLLSISNGSNIAIEKIVVQH